MDQNILLNFLRKLWQIVFKMNHNVSKYAFSFQNFGWWSWGVPQTLILLNNVTPIDQFPKRHRLVQDGRDPKFQALYWSLNMASSTEISRNLSYKVQSPNNKVSNKFKSYDNFWLYPPLWTSHLVTMHDNIGNRSVIFSFDISDLVQVKWIQLAQDGYTFTTQWDTQRMDNWKYTLLTTTIYLINARKMF